MLYIINTIESRNIQYTKTYNQLIALGVDKENIIIDYGYTQKDRPCKKPYHVIHYNFFERILPMVIDRKEDLVYLEDSVKPLQKVEDIEIDAQKINWLGYIFNNPSFTCGVKMVYIPYEICVDLLDKKDIYRPQYIDRLIRNYGIKHNCLKIDKNYIKLYRVTDSSWGTTNQILNKETFKKKLYVEL